MKVLKKIFRGNDIRGIYPSELNSEVSYLIGRAFGTKLIEKGVHETLVAYDNRLSSMSLEISLVKGLMECGIHVKRLGLATTPMCYYATNYYNVKSSIMVTASHNPKEYNGYKFSYDGITNAYGDKVLELYDVIESNNFVNGEGSFEDVKIEDEYIKLITDKLEFGNRRIKVVYDPGNGTASIIDSKVFEKLPMVDSIAICDKSNGNFPLHHPDPSVEDNLKMLKDKVLEVNADVGIAYDGDADRSGFVDNKGRFVAIDKYMAIMWKDLVNKVDKKECLYDVKCSKLLEDELIKIGVKPIEFKTGAAFTHDASVKGDYPLSGEYSGHVYFRDKFPGYDDGIYIGMRLIEMLSHSDKPFSSYVDELEHFYSTPEIKVKVTDENKFDIVESIKEYALNKGYNCLTIDGVKVKFNDGFALIRASNTGPHLTLRFEATTESRLNEIKEEFESEIQKYI